MAPSYYFSSESVDHSVCIFLIVFVIVKLLVRQPPGLQDMFPRPWKRTDRSLARSRSYPCSSSSLRSTRSLMVLSTSTTRSHNDSRSATIISRSSCGACAIDLTDSSVTSLSSRTLPTARTSDRYCSAQINNAKALAEIEFGTF